MIDVISPCTTFNDHEGSTKSYSYMKDHEEPLHALDFVPFFDDISVEIPEGETSEVELYDGSRLRIRKLGHDFDPTDRMAALAALDRAESADEVLTGVLYVNTSKPTFVDMLQLDDSPLATLPDARLRPSPAVLEQAMEELR